MILIKLLLNTITQTNFQNDYLMLQKIILIINNKYINDIDLWFDVPMTIQKENEKMLYQELLKLMTKIVNDDMLSTRRKIQNIYSLLLCQNYVKIELDELSSTRAHVNDFLPSTTGMEEID